MNEILKGLTDLSFRKFITPKIMKYIYLALVLCAAVGSIATLWFGWFGLIIAPVSFVAAVCAIRVFVEVSMAILQIAKYSAEMARRGRDPSEINAAASEEQA